ncbi:MAG: hypothetical protein ACYCT7_02770 [bacterium]
MGLECVGEFYRYNPFKILMGDKYYQKYADLVCELIIKITNLLNIHRIQLVDEDIIWLIYVKGYKDDKGGSSLLSSF